MSNCGSFYYGNMRRLIEEKLNLKKQKREKFNYIYNEFTFTINFKKLQ